MAAGNKENGKAKWFKVVYSYPFNGGTIERLLMEISSVDVDIEELRKIFSDPKHLPTEWDGRKVVTAKITLEEIPAFDVNTLAGLVKMPAKVIARAAK